MKQQQFPLLTISQYRRPEIGGRLKIWMGDIPSTKFSLRCSVTKFLENGCIEFYVKNGAWGGWLDPITKVIYIYKTKKYYHISKYTLR